MYDIEKLKEELRPIHIISYLNVPYRKIGHNIYILCPDHEERTGRADRHIGNCVIGKTFENAYYCFGCGARGNSFELIAKLKNLDIKSDFYEVLEVAAEICGGSELFQVDSEEFHQKREQKKKETSTKISFTKEELSIIGLCPNVFSSILYEGFSPNLIKDNTSFEKDVDVNHVDSFGLSSTLYVSSKPFTYSLTNLASDDYEAYLYLIKTKAFEAMEHYKTLALMDYSTLIKSLPISIRKKGPGFSEMIKDECKNLYLEAENIYKEVGGEKSIDDSWIYMYA